MGLAAPTKRGTRVQFRRSNAKMADNPGAEEGGTLFTSRRSRRRSSVPPVAWVGIAVLVLSGVVAWWLWLRSPEPAPQPAPVVAGDSAARTLAEEPFVIPSLNASDAAVRTLVEGVSAHPQLAAWLVPDDLIRRFVEAVVDISRGSSPLPAMEVLIPPEPFSVDEVGDRLVVDPRSQERFDLLAQVVASIDPQAAARVYRQLLPLFREAYQEMGMADGSFEEVLDRAIDNLLAVRVPEGPLEVQAAIGRYVYVDRSLEDLTPAAKHLLRMGPENARLVQEKLAEIRGALDLSGEATPSDSVSASDSATAGDSVAAEDSVASVSGVR